jgi:hypothetical protein
VAQAQSGQYGGSYGGPAGPTPTAGGAALLMWDQCGGEGGSCKQAGACVDGPYPGKACPAGASCQKQSNWYYQCLPTSSAAGGPTASTPAVGDLKLWDQCGGEGGNCKQAGACVDGPYPGKACPAGASCQKQNNWYYQCLPAGSTPSATPSATPTPTPTPSATPSAATPAASSPSPSPQLKLWDQCGGEGGSCKEAGTCVNGPYPGRSCPSGSSCLKQSNWYYQCLPTDGYTCIPADGNAPGGPGGSQFTLNWWDQCGGMGGNCNNYGACADNAYASYACPSGTSCQRQNQWVGGWGAAGGGCGRGGRSPRCTSLFGARHRGGWRPLETRQSPFILHRRSNSPRTCG